MRHLATLLSGLLFGFGLAMSGMLDRARIVGFLDVAGNWDPTLLFVFIGALGVSLVSFRFVLKQKVAFCGGPLKLPSKRGVDRELIIGAAIFGAGWGLSGYCPGPGTAALGVIPMQAAIYLAGLALGSALFAVARRRPPVRDDG